MSRAFTLIELLIVVAIISILAALAIPNFQEAQIRAKVAAAKSNMRTVATMLEVYNVDFSKYPTGFTRFVPDFPDGSLGWPGYPDRGSMILGGVILPGYEMAPSQFKMDPFVRESDAGTERPTGGLAYLNLGWMVDILDEANWSDKDPCNWRIARELGGSWLLRSVGPAGIPYYVSYFGWADGGATSDPTGKEKKAFHEYDPTNGSVSLGYIFRTQKRAGGLGTRCYFYDECECPPQHVGL
jgi:prepilin-type N-terminal cleavage/methylation domain-containing protein